MTLDLFRQVLDHTVIDVDGTPCGCVDDVAAERTARGARITSLLIGPGAFAPRLPALLATILPRFIGRRVVRVPWSEVAQVGELIRLKSSAASLGLGATDRRLGALLRALPGSGEEK